MEVEGWVEKSIYSNNSRKSRWEIINRLRIKTLANKILEMDDKTLSDYVTANYPLPEKEMQEFVDGTRPYRSFVRKVIYCTG